MFGLLAPAVVAPLVALGAQLPLYNAAGLLRVPCGLAALRIALHLTLKLAVGSARWPFAPTRPRRSTEA